MEDEGFITDDLIEDTARDYVARYGWHSLDTLRERAAIAEQAGDWLLAQTWNEIADIAERLIGLHQL